MLHYGQVCESKSLSVAIQQGQQTQMNDGFSNATPNKGVKNVEAQRLVK